MPGSVLRKALARVVRISIRKLVSGGGREECRAQKRWPWGFMSGSRKAAPFPSGKPRAGVLGFGRVGFERE